MRRRRPRIRLMPLIEGGGQEEGRRSGTLNVPGIVGLAVALQICSEEMDAELVRVRALRDRLYREIIEELAKQPRSTSNDDIRRDYRRHQAVIHPGCGRLNPL